MGVRRGEDDGYLGQGQIMGEFRKALFSRVMPCVKDISLRGDKTQKAYADMGVLGFQDSDLDELNQNDEDVAEQTETGTMDDDGSRAHALADPATHA